MFRTVNLDFISSLLIQIFYLGETNSKLFNVKFQCDNVPLLLVRVDTIKKSLVLTEC